MQHRHTLTTIMSTQELAVLCDRPKVISNAGSLSVHPDIATIKRERSVEDDCPPAKRKLLDAHTQLMKHYCAYISSLVSRHLVD